MSFSDIIQAMSGHPKKPESKKAFCRSCKRQTNHKVIETKRDYENDEDAGIWLETNFYFLQCLGCETYAFCTDTVTSEDYNPETGNLEPTTLVYPNPYPKRDWLDGFYFLPDSIEKTYRECVEGYNRNLPTLTAIGLRLIIESICKDKGIIIRGLAAKLKEMTNKGFITSDQAKVLDSIRLVGNASAHDAHVLSKNELDTVFDIVENALENAYIITQKAKLLDTMSAAKKK